jgi:hypothetical protein
VAEPWGVAADAEGAHEEGGPPATSFEVPDFARRAG